MRSRRTGRTLAAVGLVAVLLTLGLGTGTGQTAEESVRVCRMGDHVPEDHPFAGANGTSQSSLAIRYFDADQDGTLDADEPLYVDMESGTNFDASTVSAADVRWTDLPDGPEAGTHPQSGDRDHGMGSLTPLGQVNFTFEDADNDTQRDPGEPLLIDVDGSQTRTAGDRLLAPADAAGTTATQTSITAQTTLQPTFVFLLYIDTDDPQTPEGRLLFGDLDFDGHLDTGDLCLSHHDVKTSTASPTPTKATDEPTGTGPADTTKPPSPTPSPRPTPTNTTQQPGGFDRDGGQFDGRYVTLAVDLQDGVITTWQVSGVAFFDRAHLDCPCTATTRQDTNGRPTSILLQGNATILTIHDQPGGLTAFAAFGAVPIEFQLATQTQIDRTSDGAVRLQRDGTVAWLTVHGFDGSADAAGGLQEFQAAGGARHLLARGAGVFFVSNPEGDEPLFSRNREAVDEAILDRRLTAQVQVLRTDRGNEPQVLAYEDVRDIQVRQPSELEYEIEIDADFPEGRAFLFQFPRETLPAETVEVRYFHQADADAPIKLRTLTEAATLDEVLKGAQGSQATYYVETTPEGFQVAVAVPEFSIQLFQVLGVPPETAPIFAYGVALVFLFLGVGVMGVMIGRRGHRKWKPRRKEIVPLPGT